MKRRRIVAVSQEDDPRLWNPGHDRVLSVSSTYMLKVDGDLPQINDLGCVKDRVRDDDAERLPIPNRSIPCPAAHLEFGIALDQPFKICRTPQLICLLSQDVSAFDMSRDRNLKSTGAGNVIPMMMGIDDTTHLRKRLFL
jgi:hypothetical protein